MITHKNLQIIFLITAIFFIISISKFTTLAASSNSYTSITGNELLQGVGSYSSWEQVSPPRKYSNIGLFGAVASCNIVSNKENGGGLCSLLFDKSTPNNITNITPSKDYGTDNLMFMWDLVGDNLVDTKDVRFNIYRSTVPDFSASEIVGLMVPSQSAREGYVVTFSANTTINYFMIKALDGDGNMSPTSPVGSIFSVRLVPNVANTDEYRFSLPYQNTYSKASDLMKDLSPAGNPIYKMERLNYGDQKISWYWWDEVEWSDVDFDIVPTESYSIAINADTNLRFIGVNDPSISFDITANSLIADEYRISLPYNSDYQKASDLALDLGGSTVVQSISRYDYLSQSSVVYDVVAGTNDFNLVPGEGLSIVLRDPGGNALRNWRPKLTTVYY